MKEYELKRNNINTFLKDIKDNVKVGHYVKAVTINGKTLLGKVTFISSDYIYISKEKKWFKTNFLNYKIVKETLWTRT